MATKRTKAPETDESLARDIASLTPLNEALYALSGQLTSFIKMFSTAKSQKGLMRTAKQMLPLTKAVEDVAILISKLNIEITEKLAEDTMVEPSQENKEEQLKH